MIPINTTFPPEIRRFIGKTLARQHRSVRRPAVELVFPEPFRAKRPPQGSVKRHPYRRKFTLSPADAAALRRELRLRSKFPKGSFPCRRDGENIYIKEGEL